MKERLLVFKRKKMRLLTDKLQELSENEKTCCICKEKGLKINMLTLFRIGGRNLHPVFPL